MYKTMKETVHELYAVPEYTRHLVMTHDIAAAKALIYYGHDINHFLKLEKNTLIIDPTKLTDTSELMVLMLLSLIEMNQCCLGNIRILDTQNRTTVLEMMKAYMVRS